MHLRSFIEMAMVPVNLFKPAHYKLQVILWVAGGFSIKNLNPHYIAGGFDIN